MKVTLAFGESLQYNHMHIAQVAEVTLLNLHIHIYIEVEKKRQIPLR